MNLTLRARYTLAVAGMVVALSLALYMTLQWRSVAAIETITASATSQVSAGLSAQEKKRAASLVRYLAEALGNPLYKLHLNEIGDLMETAAKQPGITFVELVDSKGEVLHDGTEEIKTYGKPSHEKHILDVLRRPRTMTWVGKDTAHAISPVVLGAEVLGAVHMEISLAEAHADTQRLRQALEQESDRVRRDLVITAVTVAALFLISGIIACAAVVRRLTSPIQALSQLARKIGAGEQGATVEFSRGDEIGDLARALNSMSIRLKETTVSRDYLDSILDSMLDPLFVLKPDGTIELANAAAGHILEQDPGELKGQSLHSYVVPPEGGKDGSSVADTSAPVVVQEQGRWFISDETEIRTRSGKSTPVMIASAQMASAGDRETRTVWVARDIEARKRIETELVHATNKAELANRTKSEFLANMSHELRTPLNSIIGFSEILSRKDAPPIDIAKRQEFSKDILDSGRYLLDLINDILDLSKIDAGKFELKEGRVKIADCIKRAWLIACGQPGAHRVEFVRTIVPADLTIRADSRRMQQLVINLFSNALKFTPDGGKISVAAEITEAGCRLTISDTGVGIAECDIEKALAPFGQIDNSYQRETGGIGLGLPLTKRLAEMHDGTLSILSKPGRGTTVQILLPKGRILPAAEDDVMIGNAVAGRM